MWPFEDTLRERNKDVVRRHREWLRRWMLEWKNSAGCWDGQVMPENG